MRLSQIDRAIDVCSEHLDQTNSRGTEVEAFLAQYLAVLICGAFEEEIERIIVQRLGASNDLQIEAFARSALDAIFRSTSVREISGLLNRFSPDVKKRFQDQVCGTRAETYFTNIVTHRHQTVHSGGTTVTLRELAEFYYEDTQYSMPLVAHGNRELNMGAAKLLDKMELANELIPAILELAECEPPQTASLDTP